MRVLIFTNVTEDYLADQVLYGLRMRFGADAIDIPQKPAMYTNSHQPKESLYGRGFTYWKILEDIKIDRQNIMDRLASRQFDAVVFTSIWRQQERFQWLKDHGLLDRAEFRFLDGEDEHAERRDACVYEPALPFGPYFKREATLGRSFGNGKYQLRPISFAIPEAKVRTKPSIKTRLFATHVQCKEAYSCPWISQNCQQEYAFHREEDYYADIACSRFAITTKKYGWDCARHYEIAANLSVPAFYRLDEKPSDAAPHGLIDGTNCICWKSGEELTAKVDQLSGADYDRLLSGAKQWISQRTCEKLADYVLAAGAPGPFGP